MRVSNSLDTRAFADLRANGINPYAIGTNGASTPSGNLASSPSASSGSGRNFDSVTPLLKVVSSAFSLAMTSMNNTTSIVNSLIDSDSKIKVREMTDVNNLDVEAMRRGKYWKR